MNNVERKPQQRKKYAARGEAETKMMSIRIDKSVLTWLKSKPNMGRYINELIHRDMRKAWVPDDDEAQEPRGDFEEF